jgi:hypothetical protein
MENYQWMELYREAVLETNPHILPLRIAAAQNAIVQRRIDAVDDAERRAITRTLNALEVLELERCGAATKAAHN